MQTDAQTKKRNASWINQGTAVNASSASQAAVQAGLDWEVMQIPLQGYVKSEVNPYETITDYYPVERKHAMLKLGKDGNNSVIGIVGEKYKIVQNMEVFGALDSLVDSSGLRYTAAGEYNGGANVWMVMQLPREINVANDPHAGFILVQSSHDGSSSVIIRPIIERLFCANQINKIVKGKKRNNYTYTLKHTTNAKLSVSEIRDIMQLTYQSIEEYELLSNTLIQTEVDNRQVRNIFERVWALPTEVENSPYNLLTQGQRRQKTMALDARMKAMDIYLESPTQENIRGTAFGAWQAVIEYADHYASGGADKRGIATLTGRNDAIKTKALNLVLSA